MDFFSKGGWGLVNSKTSSAEYIMGEGGIFVMGEGIGLTQSKRFLYEKMGIFKFLF